MSETSPKALASLGGKATSPDLLRDLAILAQIPNEARGELWLALEPTLPEPVPQHAEPMVIGFCRKWKLDANGFARGLKAARFMLRAAAAEDLDRAVFTQDLRTVGPESAEAVEACLLPYFEAAKARIRGELVARTMTAHGKVLLETSWRVDSLGSSSFGKNLRTPVVWLTLRYEENGRTDTITMQALPSGLRQLEDIARTVLVDRPPG